MRAMILAAGLGTRLRPITYERPKALVDVCGRPSIDYVIAGLKKAGVDYYVINAFLYPEYMSAHMALRHRGERYFVSQERELLGTAGALLPVKHLLGTDAAFLHNADIITDEDLNPLKSKHLDDNPVITLLVENVADISSSDLSYNSEGTVTRFLNTNSSYKSEFHGRYTGIAVFSEDLFAFIKEANEGLGDDVIPRLIDDRKKIAVIEAKRPWYDIGTFEGLERATKAISSGMLDILD